MGALRSIARRRDPQAAAGVERLYPSEAYVTLEGERGKAMADQLTTVSKTRLQQMLGRLSPADMTSIEQAVKVQLGLSA